MKTDDRWLPPSAPAPDPPAPLEGLGPAEQRRPSWLGRLAAPLAALVALAGKLKALLLLLPKAKFLVTSGSMLVSIAAYATLWGWRFVDGKADEHWDPATLPAGPAPSPAPAK